MDKRSIGLFDSGFGGLTVLKELNKKFPKENFIYYADSNRAPYGSKGKSTIEKYGEEITKFFIEKNVKLVVIACNTATVYSLEHLKSIFSIPIIGIIDAGSRYALEKTDNDNIVVLATEATVRTHAYLNSLTKISNKLIVQEIACPELVPLIEAGEITGEKIENAIRKYYANLKNNEFDTVIFGCTHYALIEKNIAEIFGLDKKYINPAIKLADDIEKFLSINNIKNINIEKGNREFYTSGDLEVFKKLGSEYYGENISIVYKKEF